MEVKTGGFRKNFAVLGWVLFSVGLALALINKLVTGAAIGFSGDAIGMLGAIAFVLGLVFLFMAERGKEGKLEKSLAEQILSRGTRLPQSAEAIADIAEQMDYPVKRGKDSIGISYGGKKLSIPKGRRLREGESRKYLKKLAHFG